MPRYYRSQYCSQPRPEAAKSGATADSSAPIRIARRLRGGGGESQRKPQTRPFESSRSFFHSRGE
jgi:hypothetical protein